LSRRQPEVANFARRLEAAVAPATFNSQLPPSRSRDKKKWPGTPRH
jgi:hypothetical protein